MWRARQQRRPTPGPLRLATAGVRDTVMTYDRRLADAAAHHGLSGLDADLTRRARPPTSKQY